MKKEYEKVWDFVRSKWREANDDCCKLKGADGKWLNDRDSDRAFWKLIGFQNACNEILDFLLHDCREEN